MDPDQLAKTPLGKASTVRTHYDAEQLCAVPRHCLWQEYGHTAPPFVGVDIWNAYEISWLNLRGLPQVATGEFRVPCNTANIIESKSLKLYLNSLAQTAFAGMDEVEQIIATDLSACAGAAVEVKLTTLDTAGTEIRPLAGFCLDSLDISIDTYQRQAAFLRTTARRVNNEKLYSHLLKTNCPVTAQPDWGSLCIEYSGDAIEHDGLLKYIVSYREQSDFHEQCLENIFLDILNNCQPDALTVFARYLRRGGLDINPYRSTLGARAENCRLSRQ